MSSVVGRKVRIRGTTIEGQVAKRRLGCLGDPIRGEDPTLRIYPPYHYWNPEPDEPHPVLLSDGWYAFARNRAELEFL